MPAALKRDPYTEKDSSVDRQDFEARTRSDKTIDCLIKKLTTAVTVTAAATPADGEVYKPYRHR